MVGFVVGCFFLLVAGLSWIVWGFVPFLGWVWVFISVLCVVVVFGCFWSVCCVGVYLCWGLFVLMVLVCVWCLFGGGLFVLEANCVVVICRGIVLVG